MNSTVELSFESPASVKKKLKTFLFSSRMRSSTIRLIDTDWPQASHIRFMLANYVGLQIMSPRRMPAFLDSVEKAAIAYSRTLGAKPDNLRLQAFLNTLLDDLSYTMAGYIVLAPKAQDWRPAYGRPINSWLVGREAAKLTKSPRAPDKKDVAAIRGAMVAYLGSAIPVQLYGEYHGQE